LHSFRSRTSHANKCGVKLWNIKTASDPQAGSINHGPTETSITELRGKPEPPQTDKRIDGVETTTWKLTNVKLLKMKQEADRDYHLVLSDAQGNTMIAEIPDPVCVGVGSVVAYNVNISRAAVDAKYQVPSDKWLPVNEVITVAGVGFFDFGHVAGAQDGAAKNEIELHPVVDICFGQDCEVGVEEVAAHP
jgi:hypothetical protein